MAPYQGGSAPGWHPNQGPPTLALKKALCFSCCDKASDLAQCSACKRVAYCSVECQTRDWRKSHKSICNTLVALNKRRGYALSAGRKWLDHINEERQDIQWLSSLDSNVTAELKNLFTYRLHCCHCYRRESQLEDEARLKVCRQCHLTSFCTSCPQTHSSEECTIFQDMVYYEKAWSNFYRRPEATNALTKLPRKQYSPLSSAADWYDYYTQLSDQAYLAPKMTRELKYLGEEPKEREAVERLIGTTYKTSLHLTMIAALEAIMPNISTVESLNIHILRAGSSEHAALAGFTELLHQLPSLKKLQLAFIFPVSHFTGKTIQSKMPCCSSCDGKGRTITVRYWQGIYRDFVKTKFYEPPHLAAAFHSGMSISDKDSLQLWVETCAGLLRAPHPTLFTTPTVHETERETKVWEHLGGRFIKRPEVNKWKGLIPSLTRCADRPNEICYQNHWWYIVEPIKGS